MKKGTIALAIAFVVLTLHVLSGPVEALHPLRDILYLGLLIVSAIACLAAAAFRRAGRVAWLLVGLGVLAWALGDLYWTLELADDAAPPYPSLADAGWLVIYPLAYVAVLMLLREGVERVPASLWLDGLLGALGFSALAVALVYGPIFSGATEGTTAEIATNLAYPVGDLLLISVVFVVFSVHGWRPGRRWALLAAALITSAVADSAYLYVVATGTYNPDALIASIWPLSTLLFAAAAWQRSPRHRGALAEGWSTVSVAAVLTLGSVALLVYDHFIRVSDVAIALATAGLGVAAIRGALTFKEYLALLAVSRGEATTDSLTGLPNRRALTQELERRVWAGAERFALALFDLDGFKTYNDAFGHLAGDDLLARLASQLRATLPASAHAYRLGGDEFCVLLPDPDDNFGEAIERLREALSEPGEQFSISSSVGAVRVPDETSDPRVILTLADRRMYGDKASKRSSAGTQTKDALLSALRVREPELTGHMEGVAETARKVGTALKLDGEALDETVRAAELHDVGKLAIPDAILKKPGPLDEDEWEYMRKHTVFGERILSSAPALLPVARIVRSSHERWDGRGYPDGLAGEDIPLGARIVFACDAFHAMTSERVYTSPRSFKAAIAELRDCAGSQFDPAVVDALVRTLEQGADEPADIPALA